MRRVLLFVAFVLCLNASVKAQSPKPATKSPAAATATPTAAASPAALQAARASFARLPLSFEENVGQTDGRVKYTSRGAGYNLFLTNDEAVIALRGGAPSPNCSAPARKSRADCANSSSNRPEESFLWLKMLGANSSAQIFGTDPLPGKINYYVGNDSRKWRTGVRQFGRVSYRGIYPGVDLTYYGNQQQLESDFVVAPGANPRLIEFEVKGARDTRIDAQGNLVLATSAGSVQLLRPGLYQTIKGVRHEVSGNYVLRSANRIGFSVGPYDRREKLIIDPTLIYSTYLGGSGLSSGDAANAIAIDASGHAYVTGQGSSFDFPGSDPAGPPVTSLSNFVFITEFDATGSSGGAALVYSTILSGSTGFEDTVGNGIGVDASGNAYVDGSTAASDFPLLNPFQGTAGNGVQNFETTGFVAGLKSDGTLIYSTYFGGRNQNDQTVLQGLFADTTGDAYVVGSTNSPNFPTVNPLQASLASSFSTNVVVAKFNPQGQPIYSTYLGGNSVDTGNAIVADAAGNAYVTGQTSSTNFPVQTSPAPFQATLPGSQNVFVSKLAFNTGSSTMSLVSSTYLGGASTDEGWGIAIDTASPPNVYVTGQTDSSGSGTSGFPTTAGAFSLTNAGGTDAFATKLQGNFAALTYSTYLGGAGTDIGYSIGLDTASPPNAYITGSTTSANFPSASPLQSTVGGTSATNVFVTKLNGTGSAPLTYSTYLGGSGTDVARGIAVDTTGNAYIAGKTSSANFPVLTGAAAGTNPFQGQLGSSTGNAFVAKISSAAAPAALNFFPPSFNFHDVGVGLASSYTEIVTLSNNSAAAVTINSGGITIIGTNAGDFSQTNTCPVSPTAFAAGAACTISVTFKPQDQDTRTAQISVASSAPTATMNLTGTGGAPEVSFSSTSISFFPNPDPLNVETTASVEITNTGGGPLQVGSAQISASTPANAAPFAVITNDSSCFSAPIAPGNSCFIGISYTPTAAVTSNATLLLNTNAAGSPQTLSLTGTGIQEVLVSPTTLEMGPNVVNNPVITAVNGSVLENGSGGTITLTVTPGTGPDQTDFHFDNQNGENTCVTGLVLAPGGTCELVINFQPLAASATDGRTGSFTLSWTGALTGSQVVNVMGTGLTGISLYVNTLTAPNEFVGISEGFGLEAVINGSNNPITVSVALSGNNPGDFTAPLGTDCAPGGVIAANSFCRVDPTFKPSAIGLRTATATYTYSGVSNGQLTLALSGTGIPGPVEFPSVHDFGSEIISTTTPESKFLFRNVATVPVTISSITNPSADFKVTSDTTCVAGVVPAGGSCFIGMTFTPTTTSKETTSIVVTDSYGTVGADPNSPHTLSITGTGEPAVITISVSTGGTTVLDFGNVALNPSPIPQADIFLTNAGNSPTTITWPSTAGNTPALVTTGTAFGLVASGTNLTTCTKNAVVLPQGGSCLIGVTFNPTATGEQTNSVAFMDSVSGLTHTVTIQGNGAQQGKVSLSVPSLTFTQVAGTTSGAQSITLTNTGTGPLTITTASLVDNANSSFAIASGTTCTVGATVAASANCVFNFTFAAPLTLGESFAELNLQTNLGNNATSSNFPELIGNSVSGGFSLSPAAPINFGAVAVGSTVTSAEYTLTNENTTSVTIGTLSIPAPYTIAFDDCTAQVLSPGNECFFDISFAPTTSGAHNVNLSIPYTGAANSPFLVAVQGSGSTSVVANPNPVVFQVFSTGSTAFSSVTIANGSGSAATITSLSAIAGTNAADFTIPQFGDGCTGQVLTASGGSCSISLNFLSATAGTFSAQFNVNYTIASVAQTPITVTMSAVIPAAVATASPNPLIFPSQTVNTQSQTMNVTVTNAVSATAALSISSMQISGNDFAFAVNNSGGCFSIAAGQSCTIPITFTPSKASGTNGRTGTLTITDNASPATQVVTLEGTGVAGSVTASPATLSFPQTNIGTSVTLGAVLSNTTGSAVTFTGVAFTGPYSSDTGSGTCVAAKPVGAVTGTCVVYIKFTPTGTTNTGTATISFTGGTFVINLSGAGSNPNVNVSPTSLTFNSQAIGTSSSQQAVTLSNPTSSAVSVSSTPSISGTNAADFILGTNTCTSGANLPATTGTCAVNVIFHPGASGGTTRTATLSIADSPDANSPHLITLTGTAAQPVASLNSTTMTFGSIDLGILSGQQFVTLTNTGNIALNISSVTLGGTNAGDFALATPVSGTDCRTVPSGTLAVSASCNVAATFTPTATGSRTATITIGDNATPPTQVITLSGTGATPAVTLNPATIPFGNQRLNVATAQMTSTLTNSGTGPLTISGVTLGGTNPGDFAFATPASGTDCRTAGTLAAGGTCVIAATFDPTVLGSRSATVSIADNASGTPQTLSLTGTGTFPQATPSPSPVPFGNQMLNVASAAQTLMLTNGGTGTLNLSTVVLGGTNANQFAIVPTGTTCTNGSTLAAGANCVVKLTFTPTSLGAQTATVTFTDDASPTTQAVTLTGTGVFPQATPSPSPVPFGNQRENSTSSTQTLTLTNGGSGTLNLTTVVLGGTNASEFAIVTTGTTCTNGSTVIAGANCVVKLSFTPTALGPQTATVTFTDNANPTTQVVTLTGTGTFPQATPAPTTLPFGSQANGITSSPLTVTLTNGGTGTLNLTTVALGGTNPAAFAIASGTTCTNGSTVAPSSSCIVNVTFTPSSLTSFSATLTFTDDASPTTQVVNLTGTGVTSTVNFSPSPLSFGNQRQGTATAQMTSTLSNSGTSSLTISSVTLGGTNPGDFAFATPASGTDCRTAGSVAAGGTCVIAATFDPTALGARAATVSVADNASGSPHTLQLSGTGVFPQATPSPSPVPFGNQMLNVASAAQTLMLTNGGTGTLNLSTVVLGGTNANQFAIVPTGTTCTNGSTLAAGANCVVKLTFTPTSLGAQTATITFTDDASPTTQAVTLTGTGVFPQATPSPSPVPFGNQRENSTSSTQTLTLTNGGSGTLNLTTVVLGGTNASEFAIVTTGTTCTNGSTVIAGANCVVKLTFTPTALGAQTATVTFTDNANPTTQVVTLTGTGVFPQASPAPATIPFGSQTNGITSGPQTITLTNGGTGTLNLTTVALGGTNPAAFAIASGTTCTNGSTVAPSSSCIVNVTFTPSSLTSFSATLTFTDDASPTTQVVNLTGTGVTSTVNFSPSTVQFGSQRQGTPSAQMTSTLTNSGATSLAISGVTLTGTNPGDFALATPASGTDCRTVGTVAAAGTCVIAATFDPTATGARTATVSVADNASGSPHTFTLSGTGTAPAVSLSSSTVTFTNQIQTTTSAAQTITVTNTGTATLNISTAVLGGTNPADFAIVSGAGTTCTGAAVGFTAPNNTCTIAVTFTPATATAFSASLTIADDASPTTQVVTLSGTGVTPPTATPAPTSLTFTSQATSTTSAAQTVTLTNSGGAPLTITSISLAGTNKGDFAFASPATTCPTGANGGQVAAASSCVLSVTFSPTGIGTRTANIAIVVSGIANPAPVTLTGTGTAPDLAIAKSHTGSFEVGVNNTYAIKLTNNGTAATQQAITVTDTLPAGLGFVSGAGTGWTCNASAQVVTCTNPGPIAIAASSTVTLTVSVSPAAFPTVTNTATVADAGDSGTNDKSASDPTVVTAPDVTITKSHTGDFTVGANGVYTLKVTNGGTGPTTGSIVVTDTLPAGLSFVSNTGTGWACVAGAQNAQVVTCTYTGAALAASNGSSTFTLTVSVAPGAFPSVTNTVTVADPNDGKSNDKTASDVPTNIDNVVPTQSSFTPALGLIAGATSAQQITLTGTGFNSSTQITLGPTAPLNTPLTGTANAAGTSLTVSVPVAELAGANAGSLTLSVINPKNPTSNLGGGTAATTQIFPLVAFASLAPHTGTASPVPVVAGTPFALQMDLSTNPSGAALPADVTISCSFPMGLSGATCTPNPGTITKGTTDKTTIITINAIPSMGGSSTPAPWNGGHGPWPNYTLWLAAAVLAAMMGMFGVVRQRTLPMRRAPAYLALGVLVLAAGALVGCTKAAGTTPTPTGPSTITVTATTADGATVTSTVNITISN